MKLTLVTYPMKKYCIMIWNVHYVNCGCINEVEDLKTSKGTLLIQIEIVNGFVTIALPYFTFIMLMNFCFYVLLLTYLLALFNECSNNDIMFIVMVTMIKINMISHWMLILIEIFTMHLMFIADIIQMHSLIIDMCTGISIFNINCRCMHHSISKLHD